MWRRKFEPRKFRGLICECLGYVLKAVPWKYEWLEAHIQFIKTIDLASRRNATASSRHCKSLDSMPREVTLRSSLFQFSKHLTLFTITGISWLQLFIHKPLTELQQVRRNNHARKIELSDSNCVAYAAPIKLCPSSLGCESVNDGAKRQFLTVTLLSIIDLSVAVAWRYSDVPCLTLTRRLWLHVSQQNT